MKHNPVHKKIWMFIITIIVLFITIFTVQIYSEYSYTRKFVSNLKAEPYFLNIPLDAMNFSIYDDYFCKNQALIDPNYTKHITLPCDIHYYAKKDDTEPVLTLRKGTTVYILPGDTYTFPTVGYGLQCWPDYENGWRYGHPFLTSDITYDSVTYPMYFVKSAQLEKVAKAFYKANTKQLKSQSSASKFVNNIVGYIDQILYDNGAFCASLKTTIVSDDASMRTKEINKIAFLLDDLKVNDDQFTCTMKIQNNSKYHLQSCDIRYGHFLYTEEGWIFDLDDASKAKLFALKSGETKEFQVEIPMQWYEFWGKDSSEYIDVKLRGYLESEAADNAFNVWLEILPDGSFQSMSTHSLVEKDEFTINSPCWAGITFEEAVERAKTILHGRVISKRCDTQVHKTAAFRNDVLIDYYNEVTIEVIEVIKGECDPTVSYLELGGRETNVAKYSFIGADVVTPNNEYLFFLNEYGMRLNPATLIPVCDGYVLTKGNVTPEYSDKEQGEKMILDEYLDEIRRYLNKE